MAQYSRTFIYTKFTLFLRGEPWLGRSLPMSLKHRIYFCIGHNGTTRGATNGVDPAGLTRHSPFEFFVMVCIYFLNYLFAIAPFFIFKYLFSLSFFLAVSSFMDYLWLDQCLQLSLCFFFLQSFPNSTIQARIIEDIIDNASLIDKVKPVYLNVSVWTCENQN